MGINLNVSKTAATRVSLGRTNEAVNRLGTSLATGEAIVDATGRSIGSSLQSDAQVLDVVLTGIKQSKAMFYIAEQGIKSMYDTATQMTQIVAKAKLGFMTDDLIAKTLAPAYQQLKAELDRISDAINFNNQSLLNGVQSGSKVTLPVRSTMSTTPVIDLAKAKITTDSFNLTSPIADLYPDMAATINGTVVANADFNIIPDANSTIEFDTFSATFSYDTTTNKTTISGLRLNYQDLQFADTTSNPTVQGQTDMIMDGIKLEVEGQINRNDSQLTGKAKIVNTLAEFKAIVPVFVNAKNALDNNKSVAITAASLSAATEVPTNLYLKTQIGTSPAVDAVNITNIETSKIALTGGESGYTTFEFVTNRDLFASRVAFDFPTLTLDKLIPTLNTVAYRGENEPTGLTNLYNSADADVDIALIDSLVNILVVELGKVSASQVRINNVVAQVETQTDETYKAMSEILHTDIPKAVEELAQKSATLQLTMITLQKIARSIESVLVLVQ